MNTLAHIKPQKWSKSSVKTPLGKVIADPYHQAVYRPRDQSRYSLKKHIK